MKRYLLAVGLIVLQDFARASFDRYKVTDIGLPPGHRAGTFLEPGRFTNNGVASANYHIPNFGPDQYLYKSGSWTLSNPPHGQIYPTESDWFGYGDSSTSVNNAQAGYFRNGSFHDVPASGDGWDIISCSGTSQTKYIFGGEAPNSDANVLNRPYYFDVTTGVKTILPFIDGRDMVYAGLDTGVFAVGAGTHSTLPYLWKNGQYIHLGLNSWKPNALSRTEYVAGAYVGQSDHIYIWHDGVEVGISIPTFENMNVTGISDAGVVSTFNTSYMDGSGFKPAFLVNVGGTAKIDDLVVNKPSNMTIYGASINYDGHMFGQAFVGGEHHFVLLDPVPETATWVVVSIGSVVLIRRRKNFTKCSKQQF